LDKFHTHLDLPLVAGMFHVARSNKWGNPDTLSETVDQIKDMAAHKIKVQPCIYIETASNKSDVEYEAEILDAIKKIVPFYKHVVNKKDIDFEVSDMSFDKNMILYGPPGTGKTYSTAIYAVAICDQIDIDTVRSMKYEDVISRYRELLSGGRVAFTTFHQSYGYEEFIEGIKPVVENGNVTYKVVAGVFKEFCKEETTNVPVNKVFIIDEINRGNISKIFGELITLIEDSKRIGAEEEMRTRLPYSGEKFGVPNNVYLLGTMNTADRSIALIDTALRRRFKFVEMQPNTELVDVKVAGVKVKEMLEMMNRRIEVLYDREHTIGHSFFMGLSNESTIEDLAEVFDCNVIPLLKEYFYDDYERIAAVLGDNLIENNEATNFIIKQENDYAKILNSDITVMTAYKFNREALENPDAYKKIYE
jgi:5-methylcytosine-specific restriction protein B